jgi:alpha-L-fucosidase
MNQSKLILAREQWTELGYGMFIHFGVNTFSGEAWGDGHFPASEFNPGKLNPAQWAEVAVEAGMRYAVLTTKHHDGFCLWPSEHTDYSVRNSACRRDIVAEYVEAFRKAGLQVGLYYSLWDRNFPAYDDDALYAGYMKNQLTELLTNYGPILELWFDGGWDKDHPTRDWPYEKAWDDDPLVGPITGQRWRWREVYEHIHALQPECLVIQNSSSDRPGTVKYPPVDVRTSEHFDFIWQGRICEVDNAASYLPLEYCTTLTPDWFWAEQRTAWAHPSAGTIADWYRRARANRANLLLNVGPDKDGIIPDYHRSFLREAARMIDKG